MNTWVVAHHPVAHFGRNFASPHLTTVRPNPLVTTARKAEFEQEEYGEKIFFMKARIMAGQADLANNEFGYQDFCWLTWEEIKEKVDSQYFSQIRGMFPRR